MEEKVKAPLQWETEAIFQRCPMGTVLRLKFAKRCGFLWRRKTDIIVEAKIVAQDIEIVANSHRESAGAYLHSVAELSYTYEKSQRTRRLMFGDLTRMLESGNIEVLFVPESEVQTQDGSMVFRDLEVGDRIRAYRNGNFIEGIIARVAGKHLYDVVSSQNCGYIYENVSLADLLWYGRKNSEESTPKVVLS